MRQEGDRAIPSRRHGAKTCDAANREWLESATVSWLPRQTGGRAERRTPHGSQMSGVSAYIPTGVQNPSPLSEGHINALLPKRRAKLRQLIQHLLNDRVGQITEVGMDRAVPEQCEYSTV
jgi:hypothetical protein